MTARTKRRADDGGQPLRIDGEMTIYSAAALAKSVVTAVTDPSREPSLDLSQVTDIDTAGLQILLMARKLARARGGLALIDPNPRVEALLRLCRLEDMIASRPRRESAA
ncbi:MAG TPA: STAS domain-containing protein [Steroidobacteraceae bacterium]|nr:STAS domain-containing protein [Steroidobacteraceae bacterium]